MELSPWDSGVSSEYTIAISDHAPEPVMPLGPEPAEDAPWQVAHERLP